MRSSNRYWSLTPLTAFPTNTAPLTPKATLQLLGRAPCGSNPYQRIPMNTIHRLNLTKERFLITRTRRFFPLACAVALMLPVAPILGSGRTGHTYASQSDGSLGPTIANVTWVIFDSDVDHLIVVTRFKSGVVRVVPMRF
jgi:hypothetical protein